MKLLAVWGGPCPSLIDFKGIPCVGRRLSQGKSIGHFGGSEFGRVFLLVHSFMCIQNLLIFLVKNLSPYYCFLSVCSYNWGRLFKDIGGSFKIRSTEIHFDLSRNFFKIINLQNVHVWWEQCSFLMFGVSYLKILSPLSH